MLHKIPVQTSPIVDVRGPVRYTIYASPDSNMSFNFRKGGKPEPKLIFRTGKGVIHFSEKFSVR
ncbi:MAG: hypothetical protein JWM28_57 [Chitinophagaceae bacterium]|nr:hypothetical protein [Chitinophagaceae bacterium]